MYHVIPEQELHPDDYVLTEIDQNITEDECFDFLSKPRQTQSTIGLYLKKKPGARNGQSPSSKYSSLSNSHDSNHLDPFTEKKLQENKCFWVDKPTAAGPLIFKLKELYGVNLPREDPRKNQGIFYRPDYLELDYLIKLGKAGLLYPDEEISDSEDEVKPDNTLCLPLRKQRYKICDPCKEKQERHPKKADQAQVATEKTMLPFKKIPTGCQCNFYGEHNTPPTVWDKPFSDEVDMIRSHEMNKCMRPFKCELLNKNYVKNPPVTMKPASSGSKRTFPQFML